MEDRNLFERLVDNSPGMEIWWDSSPVIFDNWCKKILQKADPSDANLLANEERALEAQLTKQQQAIWKETSGEKMVFPFDGLVWADEVFKIRAVAQTACLKRLKHE